MGGYVGPAMYLQYQTMPTQSVPRSGGSDMGWVPAAIGAGASIGGAAMGGKAAKDAAASQERSAANALKFAREQEETRKQQYAQAFGVWRNAQNIMRERYGLPPLPEMTAFPGSSAPAVGSARPLPGSMSSSGVGVSHGIWGTPQNYTLGELMETKNKDQDPFAFPGA